MADKESNVNESYVVDANDP